MRLPHIVFLLNLSFTVLGSLRSQLHLDLNDINLPDSQEQVTAIINSSLHFPRIDFSALDREDERGWHEWTAEINQLGGWDRGMVLKKLAVSGPSDERVNLMFFSDGYTMKEEAKFEKDAMKLAGDIVSDGPMAHVAHLINIWGAFVPSLQSGVGSHSAPLEGAAFGLYRPGSELRAVYVHYPKRARAACRYWRESTIAGCDQAILLGNDPLYGGLGGEFTVITASELNGPLVLRHELGHSLIPVGEEYEGGYAYFGANSDKVNRLGKLKWSRFLTIPEQARIEDVKVPLQVYPWLNLDKENYNITFTSSSGIYPSALLRASVSSIPEISHLEVRLNGELLDLSDGFPESWGQSLDRRWIEISISTGLSSGSSNIITVALTEKGKKAEPGQGGKMLSSLEMIEYGPEERFNGTRGYIGAFPTYSVDGKVTLRPTNEECLMRKINHPICSEELERSLKRKIAKKGRVKLL